MTPHWLLIRNSAAPTIGALATETSRRRWLDDRGRLEVTFDGRSLRVDRWPRCHSDGVVSGGDTAVWLRSNDARISNGDVLSLPFCLDATRRSEAKINDVAVRLVAGVSSRCAAHGGTGCREFFFTSSWSCRCWQSARTRSGKSTSQWRASRKRARNPKRNSSRNYVHIPLHLIFSPLVLPSPLPPPPSVWLYLFLAVLSTLRGTWIMKRITFPSGLLERACHIFNAKRRESAAKKSRDSSIVISFLPFVVLLRISFLYILALLSYS